ncbi:MAG: hypothetical protein RLZZ613_136 [Pseudomonadota bacterium]|jgi:hypothetical protein
MVLADRMLWIMISAPTIRRKRGFAFGSAAVSIQIDVLDELILSALDLE